jgi:CRISPR/Cas system-associated exonuclease Cas4 (RecB family)
VIVKFVNADEKVETIMLELNEVGNKLEDAKANGKATKAIENKIEKLEGDLSKWLQNQDDRLSAIVDIEVITTALESLKAEAQPLMEEYEANKYNADLEACKTQHGFQVALYSLMYMIVHGIEIKRVRLENVVKSKTPHIQIFEWELDDRTLEKAEDAIQMVVSTIEAFFDGVDPRVLFRPNQYSYFGSETNELLASFGGAA